MCMHLDILMYNCKNIVLTETEAEKNPSKYKISKENCDTINNMLFYNELTLVEGSAFTFNS